MCSIETNILVYYSCPLLTYRATAFLIHLSMSVFYRYEIQITFCWCIIYKLKDYYTYFASIFTLQKKNR